MQLDQTHVVIRTRTISEIGDLAILVSRRYFRPIAMTFGPAACGWGLLNAIILVPPLIDGWWGTYRDDEMSMGLVKYAIWMVTLVSLQLPVAGVATTAFLGQAVFESELSIGSIWKDLRSRLWSWWVPLAIVRLPVVAMIWVGLRMTTPFDAFDIFIPLTLLLVAGMTRANRPFLPEIIILERCPRRPRSADIVSRRQRSKSLHQPYAADLSARFAIIVVVAFGLAAMIGFSMFALLKLVFGDLNWVRTTGIFILAPAGLWAAGGLTVVVRLLSYLDCRTRLEGWDVELAVRAELARQFPDEVDSSDRPGTTVSTPPTEPTVDGRVVSL